MLVVDQLRIVIDWYSDVPNVAMRRSGVAAGQAATSMTRNGHPSGTRNIEHDLRPYRPIESALYGQRMTVLLGFDGSKTAAEAMRWAGRYADAMDDRLVVLRAWQYPAGTVLPRASHAPLLPPDEVQEALRQETEETITEILPGPQRVTCEVVGGPAAAHLVERARDPEVRAVVLGSRGLGGFTGLLLGSVTRACLDHAAAPIVVVPDGFQTADPVRSMLVGLDGSDPSLAALDWACAAGRALGATITAVTVFSPDQAELRPDVVVELRSRAEGDLERWCGSDGERAALRRLVVDGDPRAALIELAANEQTDLVVVGTRGRGPVQRLLLGSVASALAHHAATPVAVVPIDRRP